MVLALLVLSSLSALDQPGKEALAAKLEASVVVLRMPTVTGASGGHGTGFVIQPDGLIVTNHHVVEHAERLEAVFADGRSLPVLSVVRDDPDHDLALVRVAGGGLPVLPLAERTPPAVGSPIYTYGSPLGLDFTFAEGMVAAYRPDGLPKEMADDAQPPDRQPTIQTQITGGAGGSGSPVVDEHGRVVGIHRAGMGGYGTIGFAVPVAALHALLSAAPAETASRRMGGLPWVNLGVSTLVLAGFAVVARRVLGRGEPRRSRGKTRLPGVDE